MKILQPRFKIREGLIFMMLGTLMVLQIKTVTLLPPPGIPPGEERAGSSVREAFAAEAGSRGGTARPSLRASFPDPSAAWAVGVSRNGSRNRELERRQILAGEVPVEGPGVQVHLADNPEPLPPEEDHNPLLVHDNDILTVVNELKAAGAEALAVNGQRLVATSEIRCSGPIIKVNGIGIAAPYEIGAIGDPNTLVSALDLPMGIVAQLRLVDIEVQVIPQATLQIPALAKTPTFRFATPCLFFEPGASGAGSSPAAGRPGPRRETVPVSRRVPPEGKSWKR